MLRIINFTRNVGANVLRSSIREDRPKSSSLQSPPNQFLFWFNEVPGSFTPASLRSLTSTSISQGQPCITFGASRELSHYKEFSEHHDHDNSFDPTLECLRAARFSALLALSYSIVHDKLVARYFENIWNSLNLESILRLHCPVLSVKQKKTVHCKPLETRGQPRKSQDLCCARIDSQVDTKKIEDVPLSTSDYSSSKSDDEDLSSLKFTQEESKLLQIQNCFPGNVEDVILSIQKVKNGEKDGVHELTMMSDDGNSLAQFYLGQVYENGIVGAKNLSKALQLYTLASNAGNAEAKFNLGLMLLRRGGGDRDTAEGERLVREAAQEGVREAREILGLGDIFSGLQLPEVRIEDVEAVYKIGQEMEDHDLCDAKDMWAVLDSYKTAALAGNKEAAEKYNKLSSCL